MTLRIVPKTYLVVGLMTLGTSFGSERAIGIEPDRTNFEEGVEVLTRGPVHEAFAETVTFDPKPGSVVPKAPPADIEELPPEQKPDGANVAWISGYWGWDDERSDFLWVSGIWRDLPPDRQWVSGYWGESAQGYQWTAGYWADARASEVEYLPEPPQSVEAGPNVDAPSPDHAWIPGSWVWHEARYAWRPGNWVTMQPDWVWVPAYYVWTRRGYVFVDGYYDYSVARRGVLFAPVHFAADVYSQREFSYSPATVINLAVFANHLFLRPASNHYYFGDYYAANYRDAGFYPRFSYHNHNGYDPFYAHDRWRHRRDRQWERRQEEQFRNFRDHEGSRPPRTWMAQREWKSRASSNDNDFGVAASLAQVATSKDGPVRFQPLDKNERQQQARRGRELQKFRVERQRREISVARTSAADTSTHSKPTRMKLSTSPILARSANELSEGQRPPRRYEALKPNSQVQTKARPLDGKHDLFPEHEPPDTQADAKRNTQRPQQNREDITPQPTSRSRSLSDNPSSGQPRPYRNDRPQLDAEQPSTNELRRAEQPRPERRADRPQPQADPRRAEDASGRAMRSSGKTTRRSGTDPTSRSLSDKPASEQLRRYRANRPQLDDKQSLPNNVDRADQPRPERRMDRRQPQADRRGTEDASSRAARSGSAPAPNPGDDRSARSRDTRVERTERAQSQPPSNRPTRVDQPRRQPQPERNVQRPTSQPRDAGPAPSPEERKRDKNKGRN